MLANQASFVTGQSFARVSHDCGQLEGHHPEWPAPQLAERNCPTSPAPPDEWPVSQQSEASCRVGPYVSAQGWGLCQASVRAGGVVLLCSSRSSRNASHGQPLLEAHSAGVAQGSGAPRAAPPLGSLVGGAVAARQPAGTCAARHSGQNGWSMLRQPPRLQATRLDLPGRESLW